MTLLYWILFPFLSVSLPCYSIWTLKITSYPLWTKWCYSIIVFGCSQHCSLSNYFGGVDGFYFLFLHLISGGWPPFCWTDVENSMKTCNFGMFCLLVMYCRSTWNKCGKWEVRNLGICVGNRYLITIFWAVMSIGNQILVCIMYDTIFPACFLKSILSINPDCNFQWRQKNSIPANAVTNSLLHKVIAEWMDNHPFLNP